MGHWNHRVIRHNCQAFKHEPGTLEIVEMHYGLNDDKPDEPFGHGSVSLLGEDLDDLEDTVARMYRSLKAPVMDCMCDVQAEIKDLPDE